MLSQFYFNVLAKWIVFSCFLLFQNIFSLVSTVFECVVSIPFAVVHITFFLLFCKCIYLSVHCSLHHICAFFHSGGVVVIKLVFGDAQTYVSWNWARTGTRFVQCLSVSDSQRKRFFHLFFVVASFACCYELQL